MTTCNMERLNQKIKTFRTLGAVGKDCATGLPPSQDISAVRTEFIKRMEMLGATVMIDTSDNIYATLSGSENLPVIMIGARPDLTNSYISYDGTLGMVAAIEVAETIVKEKLPHRHPITVTVWATEEDSMNLMKTAALIELHIAQGSLLEAGVCDIGVVEGICGSVRYEFTFNSQQIQSGRMPLKNRSDSVYAATRTIQYLQDEFAELDSRLIYTFSKLTCYPDIPGMSPGEVRFTLDAGHQDSDVIRLLLSIIKKIPSEVENCKVCYTCTRSQKTITFPPEIVEYVELSTKELRYSSRRLYGGPGLDKRFMSDTTPAAMLYVPEVGKHNNCELEYIPLDSCLKGANVLLKTVLHLDKQ